MKKQGILNSEISVVLSSLGHTDEIVIADCGLPIPSHVKKIDISLKLGQPGFIEVFEEILKDMKVETVTFAQEIKEKNQNIFNKSINLMFDEGITGISYIPHDEFKKRLSNVKAVIRTGEDTPYANIILSSGVIF